MTQINNSALIESLKASSSSAHGRPASPHPVTALPSSPLLLDPLPTSSLLDGEAQQLAIWEYEKQVDDQRKMIELEHAMGGSINPTTDETDSRRSSFFGSSSKDTSTTSKQPAKSNVSQQQSKARIFQSHDVYKAIDQKDIMTLMSIRDVNFSLLLNKPPGGAASAFPLVYAMRCGEKWSETVIVLVGALSRWVNHLEENVEPNKEEKGILKSLRINLKAGIDFGLETHQTNLISSYLQVLIMSEGDAFINKSVGDLTLALRAGPPSKPVELAGELVRKFMTKELRGVDGIAAVEDYIANATSDLLLLALHVLLAPPPPAFDPLPTYAFARDTRMLSLFKESYARIPKLGTKPPRLRRLAETLVDVIGETREGFRTRVKRLTRLLDGEGGMK